MSLPLNQDFHKDSRAIAYARVARGMAFDAKQPRQQRDPSYKGVPPDSTGSWQTPFTINHDMSWKPLIPLRKQEMDLWNQEATYRYMLSRGEISGGAARSPEAQKYFNERLRKRGVQAAKLYNPLMLGKVIDKALSSSQFGKFELARKIERMDDILDSSDKVTLIVDAKALMDLIDGARASILALAPEFTVSEAQNMTESIGAILKKADALLGTALGKDINHIRETDAAYDAESLKQNTKKLAAIVSSLRKLFAFSEKVWAAASTTDAKGRSAITVAAAQEIFTRPEIGSALKEANVQLGRWRKRAEEDTQRMVAEQQQAEQYAEALQQQAQAEQLEDIPAYDARDTALAAQEASRIAEHPTNEIAVDMLATQGQVAFPFSEEEVGMMSEEQFRDLALITMLRGQNVARKRAREELDLPVQPESVYVTLPKLRQPQSAAEGDALVGILDRLTMEIFPKKASAAAAAVAAPAAAEKAFEKPIAAVAALPRNDQIKYYLYYERRTQMDVARQFGLSQSTISKIKKGESEEEFKERVTI